MKAWWLYIVLVLLIVSCGGNRGIVSETVNNISVEETDFFVFDLEGGFNNSPEHILFNEMIDSVSYIPLETHQDALLPADYCRFVKVGSDLLIRGGRSYGQNPIYQFDSLGRFVRQITYHGRGPNEILIAMKWYANPNLKQINVVSTGEYMVVASTESGDRFTVRINERQGFDRVPLHDSTFVSAKLLSARDTINTYLYFIDRTGNVVHSIDRNDELANYDHEASEYTWAPPYENYWLTSDYKGDAIFHDIFNDTLYRIKNHREVTPHLVFKRGALSPRPEDTHKIDNKRKQVYFFGVMESGDHVFLNYQLDGKIWCDVWSKRTGDLLMHVEKERYSLISDVFLPFSLPDGSVTDIQVVYADRDNVYCVMEAFDACKFMPNVKEDDNPVIMIAKLKK